MKDYKVCIIGAGGVGGYLAARLAAVGCEVSVIARGAHLEAIQVSPPGP
jgi:2-dehydropantoate 2-reductase